MLSTSQMDTDRRDDSGARHPIVIAFYPGQVKAHDDALLDEALEATFPASDPVSSNSFN